MSLATRGGDHSSGRGMVLSIRPPLPAPFKSGICSARAMGPWSFGSEIVPVCVVSVRLRERNDGWLGEALNLVEPVELFAARKKVGLDHDRVPAIDGFSFVTD